MEVRRRAIIVIVLKKFFSRDEYQDVNRLQEAILYWVRQVDHNPGNMFMVGM